MLCVPNDQLCSFGVRTHRCTNGVLPVGCRWVGGVVPVFYALFGSFTHSCTDPLGEVQVSSRCSASIGWVRRP